MTPEDAKAKIEEGKGIVRALSELKHDMGRNKVLQYVFPLRTILRGRKRESYHPLGV